MDHEMSRHGRYGISTLCRKTGLTPALLRAWEKRYGLLEPRRTEGGHRYYSEEDLRVLQHVTRRLEEGARIGEVAALGREELLARSSRVPAPEPQKDPPDAGSPESMPALLIGRLLEAAERYDSPGLAQILDDAFARYSPLFVIRQILEPAARQIGDRWVEGTMTVASEHLFSGHVARRLQRLLDWVPVTHAGPRAICAGFPDETHEVGILSVAYHLALGGCRVLYLGPCLPLRDLELAAEVTKPQMLCLSVLRTELLQRHKPALLDLAARFQAARGPRLVLGGPGAWTPDPELEAAGVEFWPQGQDPSLLLSTLDHAR